MADQENNRVQKFTADGQFLDAFGHAPRQPGYSVGAVAVAPDSSVYVTNLSAQRVEHWVPVASGVQ